MALAEFLPVLLGGMTATVGLYLLSFRAWDRRRILLGLSIALLGVYALFWRTSATETVEAMLALVAMLLTVAFFVAHPSPVRLRSWTTAWVAVIMVWAVASVLRTVTTSEQGTLVVTGTLDYALMPNSLGASSLLAILGFIRLRDLAPTLDDRGRASRMFYLLAAPFTIVGGGFTATRCIASILGAAEPPIWLLRGADPWLVALAVVTWWVAPGAFIVYSLARWRWRLPLFMFAAGALSYLPLLVRPDLDIFAVVMLRSWGVLLVPALILYAQARWAPFQGEPARMAPTILLTVAAGGFAYVFVFIAIVVVSPNEAFAFGFAPVAGLAVAIGIGFLVLPRARRMAMRRLFVGASSPWAAPLQPGAIVLGRYRVVRLLGEGGQGRVYEAHDRKRQGRPVVLKAVMADIAAQEAELLRRIDHPNIVRFVDIIEVTGVTLLVLEFETGGDVRRLLSRTGGKLPAPQAFEIAAGILAGLAELHSKGIAHRDVKPENILLTNEGVPRLADFGAARPAAGGATARVRDLGTLAYMAPEQLRGDAGDARADVYAAAALIHELFSGVGPIRTTDRDDFAVRRAILQETPRLSLPPAARNLKPMLSRALQKDPAARFEDAREMLRVFQATRLTIQPAPRRTGIVSAEGQRKPVRSAKPTS